MAAPQPFNLWLLDSAKDRSTRHEEYQMTIVKINLSMNLRISSHFLDWLGQLTVSVNFFAVSREISRPERNLPFANLLPIRVSILHEWRVDTSDLHRNYVTTYDLLSVPSFDRVTHRAIDDERENFRSVSGRRPVANRIRIFRINTNDTRCYSSTRGHCATITRRNIHGRAPAILRAIGTT